jgi:fused signal recognition particle receptor
MFGRKPKDPKDTSKEPEARAGFFKRLRSRLNRGNSWLTFDLANLFRGRKIDQEILDELEARLLTADVGVEATEHILSGLNKRVARKELADVPALIGALRDAIAELLAPCARPLVIDSTRKPYVILVVGVNGSGKTTTIGKLAGRLRAEGASVMLAAGDTFRAAAIEQLQIWAERTRAAFAAQQAGADPGAVAFDAVQAARSRGIDVLIADTAGRLHSQSHLMEELKKVKRVIQRVDATAPHEVLLVLDANQGQNALSQALQFHEAVGVTGLVLTKLDGTAKGGIVIAIARRLGLPIRFIGIGEQAEDFGEFDAQAFASALVEGVGTSGEAAGEGNGGADAAQASADRIPHEPDRGVADSAS